MSEPPRVTVFWVIENIYYCPQEDRESLSSPKFYVDRLSQSEWNLSIFPSGDEIKLLLHNIHHNTQNRLLIDYEISFLSKDDSVLWIGNKKNVFVKNRTSYQIDAYPTFNQVYTEQENEYLHEGTLKVRCEIWKSKKPSPQQIHYFARTRIGIESRLFHWAVEEFSQLRINGRKKTLRIRIAEDQPIFNVDLSLVRDNHNQADVLIEIKQLNWNISRVFTRCCISVLNAAGSIVKQSDADFKFFDLGPDNWILPEFLTRNELITRAREYLAGDVLNLLFGITFSTGKDYSNIEHVTDLPSWVQVNHIPDDVGITEQLQSVSLDDVNAPSGEKAQEEPVAFLPEDLLSLYEDQTMTDFELRTGDKSFPVHKVLLAARSPVFKAMFSNDLKEKDDNFLDIPDVDEDTLQKLLLFVYTDNVETSEWSSASNLYYAAAKYEILPLKNKCSVFLSDNIAISNMCEILSLADRHDDGALKSSVHGFMVNNDSDIICSAEWTTFLKRNPVLAAETLQLVYSKKLGMPSK